MITTPFREDLSIDFDFLRRHVSLPIENACRGAVALGSLGEGATLAFDEKVEILKACAGRRATASSSLDRGPVDRRSVALARAAESPVATA